MMLPFWDRVAAGKALSRKLEVYRGQENVVVLALPRGGVPVAAEVASALGCDLDLMIVRKLGTPGQEELAMGAVASGNIRVINQGVVRSAGISQESIEAEVRRERAEISRREAAYRGARPLMDLTGKCVILVDDGVATGATIRAAISAARSKHPSKIVVAVPVAAVETLDMLRREADDVVCLATPEPFMAISQWYCEFAQVGDEEVRAILRKQWESKVAT